MVRSVSESDVARNNRLIERLEHAWKRSDALFEMVRETSIREQPVELRHPVIFYLGHLPASAWNHFGREVLECESPRPEFDGLFDSGERPIANDSRDPGDWPSIGEIRGYRDGIRSAFRSSAENIASRSTDHPLADGGQVFRLALEHELVHHEILLNLFQELDLSHKQRPAWWNAPIKGFAGKGFAGKGPAGAEAGFARFPNGPQGSFELGRAPVTIGEFERFVDADGYEEAALWSREARVQCEGTCSLLPKDWVVRNGRRYVRSMFDRIPLEEVAGWPVRVSPAEARAYARWKGARLPEAHELLHAARSRSPEPEQHTVVPIAEAAGNFGFRHGSPTPVGMFSETADELLDLFGNGWDLASDGPQSTVLFGGSWATDVALVQPERTSPYEGDRPEPFTQFRLAR